MWRVPRRKHAAAAKRAGFDASLGACALRRSHGGRRGRLPLSEAVSEAVDFKAGVSKATVSAAMASTTTGFTTAADLEWAYLAMDRTPITATTIMIIPTTPTTIPITTMATATWCSGASTRATAGAFARSRCADDHWGG